MQYVAAHWAFNYSFVNTFFFSFFFFSPTQQQAEVKKQTTKKQCLWPARVGLQCNHHAQGSAEVLLLCVCDKSLECLTNAGWQHPGGPSHLPSVRRMSFSLGLCFTLAPKISECGFECGPGCLNPSVATCKARIMALCYTLPLAVVMATSRCKNLPHYCSRTNAFHASAGIRDELMERENYPAAVVI